MPNITTNHAIIYKISKFIIYTSLSIPEYSSLHPGLFKWIWIPTFAIISLHDLHPSSSTTLNKDHGYWFEESSSLCSANDSPPEVAQFTCLEPVTENRKSLVLFKKSWKLSRLKLAFFANSKQSRNLPPAKTGGQENLKLRNLILCLVTKQKNYS